MLKQERKGTWTNTNKLLENSGIMGVKTGVTRSAGPCLATMLNIGAHGILTVVLLKANSM